MILLETLSKPSRKVIVWDLDTRLNFPVSFKEYAKQAIHPKDIPYIDPQEPPILASFYLHKFKL